MLEIEGLPLFKELVDGKQISVFPPQKVGRDSTFSHGNNPLTRHLKTFLRMRLEGIFRLFQSIPPSIKQPLVNRAIEQRDLFQYQT